MVLRSGRRRPSGRLLLREAEAAAACLQRSAPRSEEKPPRAALGILEP